VPLVDAAGIPAEVIESVVALARTGTRKQA
jgi:hypothetical protein